MTKEGGCEEMGSSEEDEIPHCLVYEHYGETTTCY